VLLKDLGDLCKVNLLGLSAHVIKVLLSLGAICLVCIPLEHELPNLCVFLHESIEDLSITVLFFVQIDELDFLLLWVSDLFGVFILLENEGLQLLLDSLNIALHTHFDSPLLQLFLKLVVGDGLLLLILLLAQEFLGLLVFESLLDCFNFLHGSEVSSILNDWHQSGRIPANGCASFECLKTLDAASNRSSCSSIRISQHLLLHLISLHHLLLLVLLETSHIIVKEVIRVVPVFEDSH